jgi:hypothetical protein
MIPCRELARLCPSDRRDNIEVLSPESARCTGEPRHVAPDNVMRYRICSRDVALNFVLQLADCPKRKGVGSASPSCSSNFEKSIVLRSSHGGVPVFNRPHSKPMPRIQFEAN